MLETRPRRLALLAVVVVALLVPAISRAADPSRGPIVLAAPPDFGSAVAAIEKATGATGEKLPFGDVPLSDARSFAVEPRVAERLLDGSHGPFAKAGFFLFRYERSYGMAGEKDRLGLVKGSDHRAVIRRVGTGQAVSGLGAEKVIAWLDALAKDEPFEVREIGSDYVAGRFVRRPKDAAAVARRCAEFAPELVAGRASTLELLAHEIRSNGTLYLIW
jgi:hypothetical protein